MNSGIDESIQDVTFNSHFSYFERKYPSLYKFKFIRKILRVYSRILTKRKSKSFKKYFS